MKQKNWRVQRGVLNLKRLSSPEVEVRPIWSWKTASHVFNNPFPNSVSPKTTVPNLWKGSLANLFVSSLKLLTVSPFPYSLPCSIITVWNNMFSYLSRILVIQNTKTKKVLKLTLGHVHLKTGLSFSLTYFKIGYLNNSNSRQVFSIFCYMEAFLFVLKRDGSVFTQLLLVKKCVIKCSAKQSLYIFGRV